MALTIIYIGIISYISSGSFNICGVNYQNRTAALVCFFTGGAKLSANAKTIHHSG